MNDHQCIERAILGALLGNNTLMATAEAFAVTEASFAGADRARIFAAIRAENASGGVADLMTVTDRLPSLMEEIAECDNAGISAKVNFAEWLKRLKSAEAARMLDRSLHRGLDALDAPDADPVAIAADLAAETEAARSCAQRDRLPTLEESIEAVRQSMIAAPPRLLPMFPGKSEAGRKFRLRAGELTVVAASTGRGKTALCCASAVTQLLAGNRVAYFCTESPTGDILARLAAARSGVPHFLPRRDPESMRRFDAALTFLSKCGNRLHVYGNDAGAGTPGRIAARLQALQSEAPPEIVYIDFLQNLAPDHRGRSALEEINAAVQTLHDMAATCRAALVVCSQFNRASEMAAAAGRIPPAPSLDWLKDSSLIAQLAHVVVVLYDDREKRTHLRSLKTRNLAPFDVPLDWDGVVYVSGTGIPEEAAETSF